VLRDISLISGPFPALLGLAALALLVVCFRRRPTARLVLGVVGVATLVIATARMLLPGSVDVARIPPSFYLWAAAPLVAAGLVVVAWRSSNHPRRLAGLVAVLLVVAFAADEVNAWFAYLPTAADLVGEPLPQEMPLATVGHAIREGAVVRLDIPAPASGFHHRRAVVWLPPAAQRTSAAHLPVIMMLAGTPGSPADLVRAAGLSRIAARYAADHHGQAPILVFPDHNGSFAGDTECVDGPRGMAETYLTADVPRFIAARFGAQGDHWGIYGYSEGGTCALTLSLRHPGLFTGFVDIGGDLRSNLGSGRRRDEAAVRDLFGGDRAAWAADDPRRLLAAHRFDGLGGWFVAGSSDGPAKHSAAVLVPAARAAGVDAHYVRARGHHSFRLVAEVSPAAFGWLADRLGSPSASQDLSPGPGPGAAPRTASTPLAAGPAPTTTPAGAPISLSISSSVSPSMSASCSLFRPVSASPTRATGAERAAS
jgi:S-formylglutathione hydrolase FrmB